jgi:hypothetical protein
MKFIGKLNFLFLQKGNYFFENTLLRNSVETEKHYFVVNAKYAVIKFQPSLRFNNIVLS